MTSADTHLYLLRHCQVENPRGVLYGHLPGFALSTAGITQAHSLGDYFAQRGVKHIVTSPLLRAKQTAEIIASHLDAPSLHVSDQLQEARFGSYLQGVRPQDVMWKRPLWLVHMIWPGLLPGDETINEMAARIRQPLLAALRDNPGQPTVFVSHGDPIQAFWVKVDKRWPYALHRLQCAKGGMLDLHFRGDRLISKKYVSPKDVAAAVA